MQPGGGARDTVSALVLCWDFAPVDTAESRRALALVNAMADGLDSVAVLVADETQGRARHGTDPALRRAMDGRVRVHTIARRHPDHLPRIDQWPRERAVDPAGWREQWLEQTGALPVEPHHAHAHDPLVAEAERVHAEGGIDLVVAVLGAEAPRLTLAVAADLSRRWGARLVVDLARCDPDRLGPDEPAWEAVTHAWCPDGATRDRVREVAADLAGRTTVVPDRTGWVAPSPARPWPTDRPPHAECLVEPDAWPAFVEVLEGWLEARRVVTELADATMTVRGRIPPTLDGPRQALVIAAESGVRFEPDVSVEDAPQAYGRADLVVAVAAGDGPAGRTTDHLAAGCAVVWCPHGDPQPDHALSLARQVVIADDLTPAAIAAALARAVRLDPPSTPEAESSWPGALRAVLDAPVRGDDR